MGIAAVEPTDITTVIYDLKVLYVDPLVQRHGLGRALAAAAIDHARTTGAEHLSLWVAERNEPARAFYEATGWRPTANGSGSSPSRASRWTRSATGSPVRWPCRLVAMEDRPLGFDDLYDESTLDALDGWLPAPLDEPLPSKVSRWSAARPSAWR